MRIRTIVFAIIVSVFFVPALQAKQGQRLALLIGNSHYTHGGSLDNPVNDVRAIKKALEGLGFTVMKYEDCSQKTMKRAMDKFGRKLKGKNVGLFFYAGHGVQVNGHNYLLPVDAKLDTAHDAEYDCVRADRVLAKMEGAGSRANIVILDACRDNPFERSWRRGTQGSGLAFMNAPSGSLIAYSTAPGKTALDGRGQNSPYTSALLKHIGTPDITVLQMFQKVRSTVRNKSGYKQTPWESTSLSGDFYFIRQGTDNHFSEEKARLERERQEFEKAKSEFERKQRESQNHRVEVASVPSKPSPVLENKRVLSDHELEILKEDQKKRIKSTVDFRKRQNIDKPLPNLAAIPSLFLVNKGRKTLKIRAVYKSSEAKKVYETFLKKKLGAEKILLIKLPLGDVSRAIQNGKVDGVITDFEPIFESLKSTFPQGTMISLDS